MNGLNPAKPRLSRRILAVIFTMMAVLIISFCAAVMSIIYMHADENGMVPKAFSLSNKLSQPIITILPPQQPGHGAPSPTVPQYQI
jgi:sensor domain CHASE-containing protein